MSETKIEGTHLLKDKDFVEVVDAEGNALAPVPKHWGTDMLPAGATKKSKSSSSSSSSSSGGANQRAPRKEDEEPPRNGAGSSTDEWLKFAAEKGASEDDLKDEDGEPLTREALIEKYGTPAA